MSLSALFCHFNVIRPHANRPLVFDQIHQQEPRSEQTETLVVVKLETLPKSPDQPEPLSHRIERVVKAFFADLKGLSVFLGGFKSIKKLLSAVRATEINSQWLTVTETWGSQIDELRKVTSILEIRQIFYDPAAYWNNLIEDRSFRGVANAVHKFTMTVALPIALTVSCLATRGLIADPSNIISTSATAVITAGVGAQSLDCLVKLVAEFPNLSKWKKLYRCTGVALHALLLSSASTSPIAGVFHPYLRAGLDSLRKGIDIGGGFYKFANLFVVNWKSPVPETT